MTPKPALIFVVDTSAMMKRLQFTAEDVQLATTSLQLNEMINQGLKDTIQLLFDTQKLQVFEPTPVSLTTVKNAAKELGEESSLSLPDQELLALALDLNKQQFRAIILTDDYSIQNVATELSIEYKPIGEHGIRELIQWEIYCSACNQSVSDYAKGDPCPVCGTPLKRRAISKR